jgi:addiction module RelB/DinJ family antitoxin
MKTATINVKTESELKRRAQAFAKSTGMSLSDVVNLSLRQVIKQGQLIIEESLEPSRYLKTAIKQARKQRQKGEYKSFNKANDAVSFVRNLK